MIIIICCFLIPLIYVLLKLIICFFVKLFGRISFDGFSFAGFSYDTKKDIFYSTRNAWQKNFGYTHLYDVCAPLFQMIIDTEPVRFYYNNKNWLISFWKGQYGITTGAEVGVYCTNELEVDKKTVYLPAGDNEMLDMSFILYRKGKEITRIKAKHWWLAIFKLGMFTKPKDLTMHVAICFPDEEMLDAFLTSFKRIGYKDKDYKVTNNTFYFIFKKPKTRKVWTRSRGLDGIRQFFNHQNVKLYNKVLGDVIDKSGVENMPHKEEKIILVNDLIPDALHNKNNKKEQNIIYLDSSVYKGVNDD